MLSVGFEPTISMFERVKTVHALNRAASVIGPLASDSLCKCFWQIMMPLFRLWEPGQRSRYSDWLGAGRTRGRISSPRSLENFLFCTSPRAVLGSTRPPIQWVTRALSPEVKRPGHEVDYSPPASAEVKKIWIYTSTPPYVFMA
jgi:hypothetical protein